jgi:hypothetical protein
MRHFLRNLWRRGPTDRVIDVIAHNPDGSVILGVVDLTDWGTREKALMLQERINLCMEFLDSGQLYREFPQSVGKQVSIRLFLGEQPDLDGERFLQAISEKIRSFGVGFECQKYEG